MNIKNYTSSTPVVNSINKIEHRLTSAGATHIAKMYEQERPVGMIFQISINNIPMTFKLPAKANSVFNVLWSAVRRPRPETKNNVKQQADRTAWKILSDWVDIQVSMIKLDQAEAIEVFLPYAFDGRTNKTLFEKMKESNFKQLTEGVKQ